jgi:hypothetical protein
MALAIAAATVAALAHGSEGTASAPGGAPDPQVQALTRMGISPERATQTIAVQSEVASAELGGKISAALGDSYAGVWFQPAQARFYIGVTSAASRTVAERVVAGSGVAAGDVVIQQVRSTWLQLLTAQEQWNGKHATLRENLQATTGILPQDNAVRVELSSSIPAAVRSALEDEAAGANVDFLIDAVPKTQLGEERREKKTCDSIFIKMAAFCEVAITSGVGLYLGAGFRTKCTAGPVLISGNETYMLTAGHCFGDSTPAGGFSGIKVVKSEYPNTIGQKKEIGNAVVWYANKERDMATVKVTLPPVGEFSEGLPTPVPALIAEWGKAKPATPHAVDGQQKVENLMSGATVCFDGQTSGEHCGVIKATNIGSITEHLVETTACTEDGDSGAPFFFRTTSGEILMIGMLVTGGAEECWKPSPVYKTNFEPLIGLRGEIAKYGILETFTGRSLLTVANETRK